MQSSGCQWSAAVAAAAAVAGKEGGTGEAKVRVEDEGAKEAARPFNTNELHCKGKLAASKDNLASSASSLVVSGSLKLATGRLLADGKSNLRELADTSRLEKQEQKANQLSEANNQVGDQVKRRRSSEAQPLTPSGLDYQTTPSHHPYRVLDSNILRPAEHNGEHQHQHQHQQQQQQQQQNIQQQQQRIKVTLSEPNQPEEAATSNSQPSKRTVAPPKGEERDPASRWAARENQLRRIASQRIQRRPESEPQPLASVQDRASGSPTSTSALSNTTSSTAAPSSTKTTQQQQQNINNNNNKLEGPSTRQLAIYINGKIRSNSIFCRSNSSSSFNGLLNRFTSSSNTTSALQSSTSQEVDKLKLESSTVLDFSSCEKRRKQKPPSENSCLATASSFVLPISGTGSQSIERARESLVRAFDRFSCTRKLLSVTTRHNSQTSHTSAEQAKRLADSSATQDQEGEGEEEAAGSEEIEKLKEVREEEGRERGGGGGVEEAPAAGYKLNPSSMFLRKAMRYYRLWIYSANLAIFAGTLIFILSSLYVASDYRIQLLLRKNKAAQEDEIIIDNNNLLDLSEPSLLLAYAVVALQAGLLQALGCFGAIRMKERLIQAFWYLILALTIFDLFFLLYWLNRYQLMVGSLREQLQVRLNRHYGHPFDHQLLSSTATSEQHQYQLDKTFTEILDKIQPDSQCCGISSSLDFKRSRWRQMKISQLTEKLLQSASSGISSLSLRQNRLNDDESGLTLNISQLELIVQRIPLVPATCCRPSPSSSPSPTTTTPARLPQTRVPAWSPSLVVEELDQSRSKSKMGGGLRNKKAGQKQIKDQDDGDEDADQEEDNDEEANDKPELLEQDLAQLLNERWRGLPVNKATPSSSPNAPEKFGPEQEEGRGRQRLLAKQEHYNRERLKQPVSIRLRRWALESRVNEQEQVLTRFVTSENDSSTIISDSLPNTAGHKERPELFALRKLLFKKNSTTYDDSYLIQDTDADEKVNFIWPNQLALSYEQYKTIERYLLGLWKSKQVAENDGANESKNLHLRERRELLSMETTETDFKVKNNQSASEKQEILLKQELARILREDSEVTCTPRSYYDKTTIYTRGCQPEIRAWLDWSANILFVTGFCVLTVLKFCSLVLLRLEIREMIHKIRVLKGMATEYNALHDLEAYLPRPSVCAQAAELTPCGVALAGSGLPMTTGAGVNPPHRLGGSFSEAVQAAQQQQQQQKELQQLGAGLANQGRASSMKIVAAAAMLAPTSCNHQLGIRSSSTSSAHLQLLGQHLLSGAGVDHLFQAGNAGLSALSRRHTAVAVCPGSAGVTNFAGIRNLTAGAAAAAAVGCTAGQLSRRGTCATTIGTQPLLSPNSNQQPQVQVQVGAFNRYLAAQESNSMNCSAGAGGSNQLLSLMYQHHPFKRQSSSGAHSAGNFSLEPTAPNSSLVESRRSIH